MRSYCPNPQTLSLEWTISVPLEVLIVPGASAVTDSFYGWRISLFRVMFTTGVRISRTSYRPCENNAPLGRFVGLLGLPGAFSPDLCVLPCGLRRYFPLSTYQNVMHVMI